MARSSDVGKCSLTPAVMAVLDSGIDLSQEFALVSPLNDRSQLALKARFNRRHQVDGTRYGLRNPSSPKNRHTAIKLDFAMLLGRRCVSFGTSRANSITLPKGQGIGNVHFYIHFHAQTKALLLTVASASKIYIHHGPSVSSTLEGLVAGNSTVALSADTHISFGTHKQFEFKILPTSVECDKGAAFEKCFSSWRKSLPGQLQKIRRLSVQNPKLFCRAGRAQRKVSISVQAASSARECAVR